MRRSDAGVRDLARLSFIAAARRLRPDVAISDEVDLWDLASLAHHYGVAVARGFARGRTMGEAAPFLCERDVEVRGARRVKVGKGTLLERGAGIYARGGWVLLGRDVVIGRFTILEAASGMREAGGTIRIGDRTALGDYCYLGGAGGITIGAGVLIGQAVTFHAENHQFGGQAPIREQGVTRRGIVVGDNCWIGSGARILDGVHLGAGSIVGAGAVVTHSVPEGSVAVGVPAKIISDRRARENE